MQLKAINLAIAFLLELCALAALAYWGFQVGDGLLLKVVLGIGAPLLMAVIWGRFMAPTSKNRLSGAAYLLVKAVIYGIAAIALATAGQLVLAIIFILASVVNQILLIVWQQETMPGAVSSEQ